MEWIGNAWFWGGVALALMALEAIAPGAYLLWFGLAAAAMVPALWILPGLSLAGQWILFGVLAMLSVGIGWKLRARRPPASQTPLLNQRAAQIVGRTLPLSQAITNGRGQVHADDTSWVVVGPDLPRGANVRVVGADAMTLRVVAVD